MVLKMQPKYPSPIDASRPELSLSSLDRFLMKRTMGPGCWLWTGAKHNRGYGVMRNAGRNQRATHVAWFFANEEWPAPGLVVRHKCDNPGCVRPDHLELGTQKQNVRDAVSRGRNARGQLCGYARLTDANVVDIRSADGSQRAIGDKFGVSQSMVSAIRLGKRWKHLP